MFDRCCDINFRAAAEFVGFTYPVSRLILYRRAKNTAIFQALPDLRDGNQSLEFLFLTILLSVDRPA